MAPLDSPVMACIPRRMWWKPWKWQITPMHWSSYQREVNFMGFRYYTANSPAVTNLTKEGAICIMKLYGIKHQDFERG